MMKKTKYLISLLLCAVFIFSCCLPAFAAELTVNEASGVSTVEHTVETEFTANIPAYVIPTEQGEHTAVHSLTLEKTVIPDGKELTASVIYSGLMTEGNGVELPYSLYDESDNTIQSGSKILSKAAGSPNDTVSVSFGAALISKAKYAGVYTDTATFTFDVAEKTYSIDEINADEHLFSIGRTKPEYVVAKFNDDFSEVKIFKNGEDSDGWMKDFQYSNDMSPMYQRRSTLKKGSIQFDIKNIGNYAFYNTASLSNISISNSVTSVGISAFCNNSALTSIEIPNSVTDIGNSAFYNCQRLSNIIIPDSVIYIGNEAFHFCAITSITIPNSVISIGEKAFSYCTSLTSVVIPDSVAYIGECAFCVCPKLKAIELSGDNKSYKIVDEALLSIDEKRLVAYPCGSEATEYNIPDGVTYICVQAFQGCSALNSIIIPNSVTSIGGSAFNGCSSLKSITIPYGVTSIAGNTFNSCTSLTNVVIPDSVTSIGANAFYSCKALASITIPDSVTSIGSYAFSMCDSLTSITIPGSVTSMGNYVFRYGPLRTIYGVPGSCAETYAKKNGYYFVAQ